MGWKSVREHYGIEHIVHVVGDELRVGSPFVSDLLSIPPHGTPIRRSSIVRHDRLADLADRIEADPALFVELMGRKDSFSASLPVYVARGGEIVLERCEEYGFPNVTHAGELMHDNTHHENQDVVAGWAKRSASSSIESLQESLTEAEGRVTRIRDRLAERIEHLAQLDQSHPHVPNTFTTDAEDQ